MGREAKTVFALSRSLSKECLDMLLDDLIEDAIFRPSALIFDGLTSRVDDASDGQRWALHAVWVQPVDESGQVRARVFHARALLP